MRKRESRILGALIFTLGLIFTGCDSWMTGDHFFDTIADEVKYANAEVIPVYVRYPTSTWGSTSPNGRSNQKVDIPFTVTAVDNNEYGFYKWAAFSTTNYRTSYGRYTVQLVDSEEAFDTEYADEMLGEDEVVFEDPYSSSTTVRVLSERSDVFIMPICVKRPVLQESLPAQNQTGATKNTTIQLIFSNAMDPLYLLVKNDGTELTADYTGDTFLNTDYVQVEQILAGGEHPFYADITTRLRTSTNGSYTTANATDSAGNPKMRLPATLNTSGKTLTIRLPSSDAYWPNGTILVTINQDVKDKLGYTMPNDDELVFGAGDEEDTIYPNVLKFEIGTTSLSNNAGGNYPRVGKNPNVRAYITDQTKTSESPSEGNVNLVNYHLLAGTTAYSSLPTSVDGVTCGFAGIGLATDSISYSPAVNFTDVPGVYPKATANESLGTVFQVDFGTYSGEGLFRLIARGVDNVGNTGRTDGHLLLSTDNTPAESKYVVFIRDITPPNAEACAGNISSANDTYAPYGWYGTDGLGHIQLKETSAGAITDYTVSERDPKYFSDTVWWAFYVGDSPNAWATDMQKPENAWDSSKWTEVSATPTPISTLLGHDLDTSSITEGSVSIYAIFKDDVGNVSDKATVNAVRFDGTAPQMGTLSWITPADVPVGFTGHAKIGNHTLAIPFTESLSGVKKISIEVVPPSGGATYKQAFSDADFNIKVRNSASSVTYDDCNFTRFPATPSAGVTQNLVLGSSSDALDYALKSSTSYTYQNAIYLDNLKIAASDTALEEGNYTIKVKLYDAALNESAEKTITICVDNAAPVIQKLLVKDAKQYAEAASGSADSDTYKYFLPSSAYDSSISGYKTTLEVTVKEVGGLREITLGDYAYLTSTSTVTLKNAATNAAITAPYTINTSSNKIVFSEKGTAMCTANEGFTVTITNVKISQTSSGLGSRTISVNAMDYAMLSPESAFSTLSFEGDSDTYSEVWMDYGNRSPSAPTGFVVKGGVLESDPDGYANNPTLAKTTLVFPSFGESGLKKIKLTGAKANYGGLGGTRVYLGTETSGASATSLAYTTEDGGNTIVLTYPLTGTTPTLTITNLELTSLTQGSNTLSAKYEYLAGWESSTKTTTVIYDNVAPVVGSSTLQMGWVVRGSETEIPGVSNASEIDKQYLMIPVTETNSGVRKIKIEVEKDGTSTAAASCDSLEFFGYSDTSSSDSYGGGIEQAITNTASGNEITISDPVTHGKHKYYYIRGIKISDSATMEEGNYTLHVTLYDYAGNVSEEKTIDMCNDHTKPVVQDSWFDGVKNTANKRTYTTHSGNNTLFVKVAESGSGIQKILLDHPFDRDPYVNGWVGCRVISTSDSTKLYYSVDDGATFTEVACTISGSRPNYYLTVANADAIKAPAGSDVILKITGLSILDEDYVTECAASVGVRLTDLAQNQSAYNNTHNNDETNKNLAAIAEDCDSADVHQTTTYPITMWDSEKVLQGTSLVAESGTRSAYSGYTNNPLVNIRCVMNEWVDLPRTPQSGLRAIVLEGATFTEQTEIEWKELYKPNTQDYFDWGGINNNVEGIHGHGSVLTGTYKGSKDSVAEVPFAMNTKDFYLVGNNILVLETPVSVGSDGYVELRYVKLDNTTSDGTKTVKVKVYDVAGTYPKSDGTLNDSINKNAGRNHAHSDWPEEHEASKSITYCGTAPTITVNDASGTDPEDITAATIETLVPMNYGAKVYVNDGKAYVYTGVSSYTRTGALNSISSSTPGVYQGNTKMQYFNLKITSSELASLYKYAWTTSSAIPSSSSWTSVSSSKVNVSLPASVIPTISSTETGADIYLHVADYAGNVITKRMSNLKWLNEGTGNVFPERNTTMESQKHMEDRSGFDHHYIEYIGQDGSGNPVYLLTLPQEALGHSCKIYIPDGWFNTIGECGSPIYGAAVGYLAANATTTGSVAGDITKAGHDANGAYLLLPASKSDGSFDGFAVNNSGTYDTFVFVYDSCGAFKTVVFYVKIDQTPPVLEVGVLQDPSESPESGVYTMWEGSSYVNSTKTRFNVESDGSRHIRQYVDSAHESTTKGASATNPIELYVNTNNPEIMLWTNSTDVLKFTCAVDGADASNVTIDHTYSDSLYTDYYRIAPNITETGKMYKFSAVDKGANESSIYIKAYLDNAGPTITASNVQKVNKITENVSGSDVTTNYFGSYATANVVVTDALSGLYSVNGSTSSSDITAYSTTGKSTNLASMTWKDGSATSPDIPYSLTLAAVDNFGNSSSSSMDNGGCSRWVRDVTAPGAPSLTYGFALGAVNILVNTLKSDYYNWGKDGLKVTQSSSTSWTVKFDPDNVTKITVEPSATDNSGGSGIMGYVVSDSSTPASFYSKDDVDDSIDILVSSITSTTYKYIFAVDKAGNPSSSYFTLNISPLAGKPDYTITSKDGIYTSGSSGWFKEGASVTVSATNSPDEYILQWGSDSDDSKTGTYSSTITIPNSAHGGTELSLVLYNGRQSAEKYIENGTTTKTVSTWKLDNTAPTGISVSTVTASGTGGKVYKATDGTIYYNGSASSLTITPTATENSGGSGIAGYATSTTGTQASSVTVSTSGSPTSVTIYAFDNVGNYSSETFTLAKDTTAPTVGIVEGSTTGCTEIGGTLYYKDNTAKLQLSVTDSGSGVDESTGHLKNNEEISLSDYTGGGKLTITSGKIADKVGNTQAYELISNIIQDTEAPSDPTGVTSVAATDGNAYLSETTVFYSGSTSAITLTLTGAGDTQSGLAGYTAGSIAGVTSTATTVTIPVSGLSATQNVTIKAKDGVGNVSSTGLALVLKKDAEAPSVTRTYPSSGVVEVTLVPTNKIFFKGNPSVTLGITDSGSGIPATGSLQNGGTISLGTYYNADEHSLKIPADLIYDNVGNTDTYEFDSGKIYKDETAPSLSGTLSVSDSPYVGRASVGSSTQVTWFKTGTKVSISMCENEGSGLAYWQIGTETTKQTTGTFVSGTSEGELTIPEITSPTTLYVYAEDRLGNSAYCKLSDINSAYAEKWCFNDGTAPAAPKGTAISSLTAKVGGTASSGYVFVNSAFDDTSTSYTVYYNGSASEMTVAMSSTLPTGVVGYSLSPTDLSSLGTTLTATLPVSDNTVKIFAVDYKGNVSTGLTLTLIKDVAAPTFTQNGNTINPATTKAFTLSSGGATGWKVNVFEAETTISIPITETGSGLKRYALIQSSSYEANPATASWNAATGTSIEFELPAVTSPKTNLILLLEDNVGNVTVDDATDHYKNSTIEKDGGWWMQLGSLSDIRATYSVIDSGSKLEVTLSNVAVPIKSIEATAAGATGGEKAKFDYKKDDGTIDYAEVINAAGITNGAKYTDSTGYLSHAGTVKFTLTGTGLTVPTSIKINGEELAAASISPATSLAGFIRHSLPSLESLVDNSGRPGGVRRSYGAERAVDLATYFNALSSAPEEKAEDTKIAFNIGRNMENGGIAEKKEKVVTTEENVGYMDEASISEVLPVQNHSWRAPDGFVSEETEAAGNQLLAQNAVVEFSSPNKVLTATDADLEDESGKNYERLLALALSLLSVCAVGLVVTLGRGRMKKNS